MAETLTKKQTFCSNLHKDSHTISKSKPKIRIIHIFAPEIIKTDVANFRELVQRLTGKPSENGGCCSKRTKRPRNTPISSSRELEPKKNASMTEKLERMRSGYNMGLDQNRERVKEEGLMWNAENSGGFLEKFADLEGFIQEFGEFPLLPNLDTSSSYHLHGFEGTQLV